MDHTLTKLFVFKTLPVSNFSYSRELCLVTHVSDSSIVVDEIYKVANETDLVYVKSAGRLKTCSLKKAIDVNIGGKLFCLAHIGQAKHKDALQSCQFLNATLPVPKSFQENYDFVESLKRLGIDNKMEDFSTKIVLDVRRLPNKGRVSLFKAIYS